jgi:SAM-dependent methyltransferase
MKNIRAKIKEIKIKLLEEQFFRPKWYSIFLNPYFINRNSLYSGIKDFASRTDSDAHVLDVGCGIKPYRNLFKTEHYTGIDIQGGGHIDEAKTVDMYYDGLSIPFPETSFDTIICTQVLEHATDAGHLIMECSRVMKTDGRIFISMPFTYPEHELPFDFRRFTRFEHKRLLESNGFKNINIIQTTGFFGTFGQLFVIFIFESMKFRASILKTLLSIFIFSPIQILAIALDFVFNKAGQTMDYIVIANKQ